VITHYLDRADRPERVFRCDPWQSENPRTVVGGSNISWAQFRDYLREIQKKRSVLQPASPPALVRGDGRPLFAPWSRGGVARDLFGREAPMGGPLGFCYIDGSDEYEWVKRDFDNCE